MGKKDGRRNEDSEDFNSRFRHFLAQRVRFPPFLFQVNSSIIYRPWRVCTGKSSTRTEDWPDATKFQ